ncbi:uncharacterized protein LOC132750181 [Ruditapes philippinarum]|uniref:uncharacterized protein LOC132750181 n=1 Tax=Ruditapes philippinarum TaxID=129788 RepID=UPI00295B87B3|nr:uncharacterized protein LOC132750181 [Ruditapes philippinarum]
METDNCLLTCSGHGTCSESETCVCYDQDTGYNAEGFWGDHCEIQKCPGMLESCSGHGQCIQGDCSCDEGWRENKTSCHIPDCPGTPDCNGRGNCITTGVLPSCECHEGYMGIQCEFECLYGNVTADFTCDCFPCYTGGACKETCNGHGSCFEDTCQCDATYWGEFCEDSGCPGTGSSCSGQGSCSISKKTCSCNNYWKGEGCDVWDCPGEIDCNDRGVCDGTTEWPPKCVNCTDSMGSSCHLDCIHGNEYPEDSSICQCEPCYHGSDCNTLCSDVGYCSDSPSTIGCECNEGYKGTFCEELNCPGDPDCSDHGKCRRDTEKNISVCTCNAGFKGDDCSEYSCPGVIGNKSCNGNGECVLLSIAPQCDCNHGFTGQACDMCVQKFAGDNCERCEENYIGYNTTCSKFCSHGYATVEGGSICECYDDDTNGHWMNPNDGCDVCVPGWRPPYCVVCADNFVGPKCDIQCMDDQGRFVDDADGDEITYAIVPLFRCLEEVDTNLYKAWFGYRNPNPNNVYITSKSENTVYYNGTEISDQKHPTKFIPSRQLPEVEYSFFIGPANMSEIMLYTWGVSTLKVQANLYADVDETIVCENLPISSDELPEVTGKCSCIHGYFGESCDGQCPGGGSNPCYGKGSCNTTSGECTCIEGADQSSNCENCRDGWIGDDCKFAGTKPDQSSEWKTGMVYGYGHFQTYDSLKYDCNGIGQYLLTSLRLATSQVLDVSVLRVIGANIAPIAVTNAVAMSVGGTNVVIQANEEQGFSVWLNDESIQVGSGIVLAPEVELLQQSPTGFLLTASSDLFIYIDLKQGYIDVTVNAKDSICQTGSGLLGLCDGNINNDLKLSDGNILLEGDSDYQLTYANVEDKFVQSWLTNDDVFSNVLSGFNGVAGDTCLSIHSSLIESGDVHFFTKSEITVDILFNLESASDDCATLWSYKNSDGDIFSTLVCGENLAYETFTSTDIRQRSLGIEIELAKWYKLSVVWTRSDHTIFFYLIDESISVTSDYVSDDDFLLDVFSPGGVFTLGLVPDWLIHGFNGHIDDFAVWKSSFGFNEIVNNAFKYNDISSNPDIAYIWRFNERSGFMSEDSSERHIPMSWQDGNWADIHWSVCDYEMTYISAENIKDMLISDSPASHIEECESIIDSIQEIDQITDSARLLFLQECLMAKAVSDEEVEPADILTPISDALQPNRTAEDYPLKELCNDYGSGSNWYGPNCDKMCIWGAGKFDSQDDKCYCNHGYYGSSCEKQCTVARGKPCGGGICDTVTGSCECSSEKFDPLNGCSTCASGWIGEDCSSVAAELSSSLSEYIGMCFSQGNCVMFDGQGFNLKEPGEYLLFEKVSETLSIYVRMRPCAGCKTCIQQVWIKMASDDFTIKVPLTENQPIILEHNTNIVTILSLATYDINDVAAISWIDKVTLQFVQNEIAVNVTYIASSPYLSVYVKTPCAANDQTGLLGNCNLDVNDDFLSISGDPVQYNEISDQFIAKEFSGHIQRDALIESKFIYSYPNLTTEEPKDMTQGYSLLFTGGYAMSGRVPTHSFNSENMFDVSVEVQVKTFSESGLILGYYQADSAIQFSLFFENLQPKILIYGNEYQIDFPLIIDKWYHIIVTFDVINKTIQSFFYSDKILEFEQLFPAGELLFPGAGNFFLGDWPIDPPIAFHPFNGLFGQLRVWNIYLNTLKIYQLVNDANIETVEGLVMDYSFVEGFGYETKDSRQGIEMIISELDNEVAWIVSDKAGSPLITDGCSASTDVVRTEKCVKIFGTESVALACNGLGVDFSTFFIDACKSEDSYIPGLVAYIVFCKSNLTPVNNPLDDLCSDHKAEHYDSLCGYFCLEGTPSDKGCVCNEGFWDWNCAQICPNRIGLSNKPCFAHGSCDSKDGSCICFAGFDPNSNCENCTSSFKGEHCDQSDTNNGGSLQRPTCQIFRSLQVKMFSGEIFSLLVANEWYILNPSNESFPTVKGRTVKCGKNICLNSLQITYNLETIIINGTDKETDRIKVNGNNDPTSSVNFVYIEKSESVFVLRRKKSKMDYFVNFRIRFKSNGYLAVIIKTDCETCAGVSACARNLSDSNTYAPNDVQSFSEIIVSANDQSLPDNINEPTTTAGSSLSFGSQSDYIPEEGISVAVPANGDHFSTISTNILTNVLTPEQKSTIKLSIKPENESSGGVFQYVGDSQFAILLDNNEIKVQAATKLINTSLVLPANEWADIQISFEPVGETITLDVFNLNTGTKETKVFTVPKECFADNGIIVLGKPVGTSGYSLPTDGSFYGEIDDVSIHADGNDDPLFELKFDENEGTQLVDTSPNGNDLSINDPYGRGTVQRTFSTKPAPEIETNLYSGFENSETYTAAVEICREIFTTIESKCSALGDSTEDVYKTGCVDEISKYGNDENVARQAALYYSDLCFYELNDVDQDDDINEEGGDDPSRLLCKDNFVSLGYVGSDCDIKCVHPDPETDGLSCICKPGYWGQYCDQECPGGAHNACNTHGFCDSASGVCTCSSNFNGNDCSECNTGWYGPDCFAMVQDSSFTSDKYSAFIAGNSNLKTFDGAYVKFNNRDKPCNLFSDDTIQIEAQMGPSSKYTSSVKALEFAVGEEQLTILPYNSGTVKLNGNEIALGTVTLASGFTIQKQSLTDIVITGPDNFELSCSVQSEDSIGVHMTVKKSECTKATGIFGKCSTGDVNACAEGDKTCIIGEIGVANAVRNNYINNDDLDDFFEATSKPYDESLFAKYGEQKETAGMSVKLSNGAYASLPTLNDEMINENTTEKSIELRLKLDTKVDGTVLSVANANTTFGIIVKNEQYAIKYGDEIYKTGVPVTVGTWTNLGISLNETSGKLVFYETNGLNFGQHKVINISEGIEKYGPPITEGSTALIGKWQNVTTLIKTSGPGSIAESPILTVDRVSVFKGIITKEDVNNHFSQNYEKQESAVSSSGGGGLSYDPLTEKEILLCVNFDEGSGKEIIDSVTGNTGLLGFDGNLEWVKSDPDITELSVPNQRSFSTITEDTEIQQKCNLLKSALQSDCGQAQELIDYTFVACQSDALESGSVDNAIDIALASSKECMQMSGSTTNPLNSLCKEFGARQFPVMGGEDCLEKCTFGNFVNEVCICKDGYFGSECESECPGGHETPCNNHGTCNTSTGICSCDYEWSGDSSCSTCQEDWEGEKCNIQKTDPSTDIDEIGGDADNTNELENLDGTTPDNINDGKGMVCRLNGNNGKTRMFRKAAKKYKKTFDKVVLLEIENLRILVRQNKIKLKRKGKRISRLVIDRVFITYRSNTINFELIKKKKTKNGKRRYKAFIDGVKWNGKTEGQLVGKMLMTRKNARKMIIKISEIGFRMVIRRGNIFFRVNIRLSSRSWISKGLCHYVPDNSSGLMKGDYTAYTDPTTLPDQIGTYCSSDADFGNDEFIDNTDVTDKDSGLAICCNSASANTKNFRLFDVSTKEITISFYLKTCTGCHGVIFSYVKKTPFSLDYNDGELIMYYGQDYEWRTGIELFDNKWHQIVLTYSRKAKKIVLYVFNENSGNTPTVYKVEKFREANPFRNGGSLSLGKFQISQETNGWKKTDSFVGCYDSLVFASKALDANTVSSLYSKKLDIVESYIKSLDTTVYYYDFDEEASYTDGFMEINLDDETLEATFGKKAKRTRMKIYNYPLNSCYQRTSDSPQFDEDETELLLDRKRRDVSNNYRAIQNNILERNAEKNELKTGTHMIRTKRESTYDPFCNNVFSGSSSSLAAICSTVSTEIRNEAIFDCEDADNDGEERALAISSFAEDCQDYLDLDVWPAENTCSEFENEFNMFPYMDESCSPECYFGSRDSSSSKCQCDDGYWNETCSAICPGGVEEPCSGFGTCDQTNGKCNCPISKMGSDDCSECTGGWYSSNCDIAIDGRNADVSLSFTSVGQLGLLYTLDGISHVVKTQGELLLLAISSNVVIHGKFVTCYQNYSCMSFLAARIGDSTTGFATITIQARRIFNSKPIVYINSLLEVLDNPRYFDGFKVYRTNFFEVIIMVKDLITIHVRTVEQYLHFKTEVPNNYVGHTSGLLSGGMNENITNKLEHIYSAIVPDFDACNNAYQVQLAQVAESSYTLLLTSFEHSFGTETEFSITRFKVNECNSIIHYPSDEYKYQTQGGYGLSFSKSSLTHTFNIDTSITSEITIELLVKQNEANDGGVLFSFTSDVSLIFVSGQSSLEIHTYSADNETVFNTGLELNEDFWNKIVMTYSNEDGTATVFVFDKDSAVSTSGSFELISGIFNNTGILTIGHWQAPSDSRQYSIPSGFEGSIENFLIWNVIVSESEVTELWGMDPAIPTESLLFSLQFDEGDGLLTSDSISNVQVSLPEYPWKSPEWFISDLEYSSTNSPYFALIYFKDTATETQAYAICNSAFNRTDCQNISNSVKESYYIICLQILSVSGDEKSGSNAILDMLNMCQSQHNVSSSDIITYCNGLEGTVKNGTLCTSECAFGFEYDNGTCECFSGYFGTNCDAVCPGDSEFPCSSHGVCRSDGSCDCWWNWEGNSDCSSCSSDSDGSMMGPDCSILSTTSLASGSRKVAAVSSNGYYMTFEGQQISFIGEAGAFMLFYSSFLQVKIQVYQVSCHYGSCIAAISVVSDTNSIVIAPAGEGYRPLLYIDGTLTELNDITNTYGSGPTLEVTQSSLTEISVKVTSIGSLTVNVLTQEQFLQAAITTDQTVCQQGTGVFGNCSGGVDYSSLTVGEISDYVTNNFRLTSSIILEALEIPVGDGSSITGYALNFNGTAALSKKISYPSGFSTTGIDISISMYFKPASYGGYLLSYSKTTNFAIFNTDPIKIQYLNSILETTFSAELDVWNQLILTFRRDAKEVEIYLFGNNSKIAREIHSFDCPNIFESGGTIMLGEYLPSVNSAKYTYNSETYSGLIDEFTIWKNAIPEKLIYQAHLLRTKESGFMSELASLVTFSEGVGNTAFELVNGINIILPTSPWQSPSWTVSDLSLHALRETVNEAYATVDIDPEVETICSLFFDSPTVSSNCGSVSNFIRWWYKQTCMITATNTENVTDTTMAMVDYTSVCGVTGGTTSSIYDELCGLDISYPGWLSQKCSGCAFGYTENDVCVCYYGYYGNQCDNVCPGGIINPCNGNGECDVTGKCQCNGHWTGSECNTCDSGWSGDECLQYTDVSYQPIDSNEILVAQVNLIGQFLMFDGAILDVPLRGYFSLLSIDNLDIELHGRFSVCESDAVSHLCLVGVLIIHGNEKVYISHKAYTKAEKNPRVEIMTATGEINVFDSLTLGFVSIKLVTKASLSVTVDNSDLIVKVSSISDRLLATISLPKTEWDSRRSTIDGLMTACDTSVAIKSANCSVSRESICTDASQDIPDYCEMTQTKSAFEMYLDNAIFADQSFISRIEEKYPATMAPNCFNYSGAGVSVTGLSLPESDFTLELHVHPLTTGGIILTYHFDGEYIILINHQDGLIMVVNDVYYTTGMPLLTSSWNQISLAWRDDVDILEMYLTDENGTSTVKAIPVPGSVFTNGGTLTLGQITPGLDVDIAMGDFTGYIDEVRIWSRPHNPNNYHK